MSRAPFNIVNQFNGDFLSLARRLSLLVEEGISRGMSAKTATDYAFRKLDVRDLFENVTIDAVREAFELGYGASLAEAGNLVRREAILSQRFTKDFTLKESVWKSVNTAKKDVTRIVADKLMQQKSWKKISTDIREEALSRGDISGKIRDLRRAALRMNANDPALVKDYNAKLKAAERQVSRLAKNNAPTGYLKDAYQEVIDATKTFSQKAIEKSVKYATMYKMQYEAERVVRTEVARAYGTGRYNNFIEDEDIVGVKSILSSRHAVYDICDFYANANLFGIGDGIYPKDYAPPYPYHPNCMCILSPVYKGKTATKDDFSENAAEKFISKQSEKHQKALLGAKGADEFNSGKSSWDENLKGFGLERKRVAVI